MLLILNKADSWWLTYKPELIIHRDSSLSDFEFNSFESTKVNRSLINVDLKNTISTTHILVRFLNFIAKIVVKKYIKGR